MLIEGLVALTVYHQLKSQDSQSKPILKESRYLDELCGPKESNHVNEVKPQIQTSQRNQKQKQKSIVVNGDAQINIFTVKKKKRS